MRTSSASISPGSGGRAVFSGPGVVNLAVHQRLDLPGQGVQGLHGAGQLVAAVQKAGRRARAGAVAEIELELEHAVARAGGVNRHPELHAEPAREGKHVGQNVRAQRALSGDRSARAKTAAPANRKAREAEREPEPSADARGEGRDRDVRATVAYCLGERYKARGRAAEIAVAEDHDPVGWLGARAHERARRPRRRLALPQPALAAHELRAGLARELRGRVG